MLAKRRHLRIGQKVTVKTPLLLPSFSSKGFPNVKKMLKASEEYISDEVLISAYDIHHGMIEPPFDFASTIFLDSGGYEASKDAELSETYDREHVVKPWDMKSHQKVVSEWSSISPTIFVSFDSPEIRATTKDQIERAKALEIPEGNYDRAILLKPESSGAKRVHLSNIKPFAKSLGAFACVGVTEKEIGKSVLDRMVNVAQLRLMLDEHHADLPIHIFGSLDTLSTYLYFLAGADIFDGLTWLRYAFCDGDTLYRHSYGALKLPLDLNSDIVEGRCWSNNYQHMMEMRLNMLKFASDHNFEHFGKHHQLIKKAYEGMSALLGGN